MEIHTEQKLIQLFEEWAGEKVIRLSPLPPSGSYREYFRITSANRTAIGAYNPDRKENRAFIEFSKHFHARGLPVPELYATNEAEYIYLVEDLGNLTLFDHLSQKRENDIFPPILVDKYRQVLRELPRFQIEGDQGLDYTVCYPRASFDKQSMLWDLNYFKYYFLKLAKIHFDEQDLEEDFQTFTDFLLQTDCDHFLYRDFQSRNVMLKKAQPYFIDYQGGRRGALQYDLASLLYDSKADIPGNIREELLDYYIEYTGRLIKLDPQSFRTYYYGYVLVRMMQAMGSYGFRGFYEKKEHFLLSIPYALQNLSELLDAVSLPVKIPTLMNILERVIESKFLKSISSPQPVLTVNINSFSYRRGIPIDVSGHGGGFVFDCRAIHNPGRYAKYADLTGNDQAVIDFLEKEKEIDVFLKNIYRLVDQSVEKYLKRQFTNLMISFGCTGGKHRSVYCAEKLVQHIKQKYDVKVVLHHLELEMKT